MDRLRPTTLRKIRKGLFLRHLEAIEKVAVKSYSALPYGDSLFSQQENFLSGPVISKSAYRSVGLYHAVTGNFREGIGALPHRPPHGSGRSRIAQILCDGRIGGH